VGRHREHDWSARPLAHVRSALRWAVSANGRGQEFRQRDLGLETDAWQIDAPWRFQIPEPLRERFGYPAITAADKRKILGLNSSRLYGIQPIEEQDQRQQIYRPVPADFESRLCRLT
jgi:hypothetical protein